MPLFGSDIIVFVGQNRLQGIGLDRTLLPWSTPSTQALRNGMVVRQTADALEADLAALASQIRGTGTRGRTRIRTRVILSDAHCRYVCARRPSGIRNHEELLGVLHNQFETTYEDPSEAWTLACHTPASGGMDMAVGVRSELIRALHAGATAAGMRLDAIEPLWTACRASLGRTLDHGAHWLITSNEEAIAIGYLSHGQCQFVRSLRRPDGGQYPGLDGLLARHEVFLEGVEPTARIWLVGNDLDTAGLSSDQAQRLRRLRTDTPWWAAGLRDASSVQAS